MRIYLFALGLILGSFSNSLIYRVPRGLSLMERSCCLKCEKSIAWYENIPIVSYILLRGKCSSCREPISFRYPAIELATGILFAISWSFDKPVLINCAYLIFIFLGLTLAFIDFETFRLPNVLNYSLFLLVLVMLILNAFIVGELGKLRTSITVSVLSFIFFYLVNLISKGGLGAGDVKLSATIGLITGYQGYLPTYFAFMFSFTFGSLFGLWLIIRHRAERKSKIAFGPFMFLGTLATLLLIM